MKVEIRLFHEEDGPGDRVARRPQRPSPLARPDVPTGGAEVEDPRDRFSVGLGRYLRAARLNQGLSHEEACRRTGIDRVTLIALENGLIRPARIQRLWILQLARLLDEPYDDLLLLLGVPLPAVMPDIDPMVIEAVPARRVSTGWAFNAPAVAPPSAPRVATYLATGWNNSVEQVRMARSRRELDRMYMDK
jgi:transcriptional regulator with XRE-family HTH domain